MKYQNIINQMTPEEKAVLLSGKNTWQTREIGHLNIPSISLSDGPHGIRRQAGTGDHLGLNASLPATCFPTAAAVANSWDIGLGEAIGEALGEEASAQEVHVLLGPGLNIKRSPLCGRNFEYFSEDPYLAGKMAAAYIRGIQKHGISACPKHFAVNSQELRRMAMNSVLDERTLREIYLTGFEIAVKEGKPKAIMSAYNEINGSYANENKHLLQEILREEWGFDGVVVTDWGASNDHAAGVAAGSNLEMPAPGHDSARELLQAIEQGSLTSEELDECVDTLLDAIFTLSKSAEQRAAGFNDCAHHELAARAVRDSVVLLKNQDHILPLSKKSRIAIVGDFAIEPRYQGAGSSVVNPIYLDTIDKTIGKYDLDRIGIARGYERDGTPSELLMEEALQLAEKADIVLYFFGLDELSESEGMDRSHMGIPQNQTMLLERLYGKNKNIVGILSAGSAIEMPWEKYLKAILHGYLTGQAGAGAILDILTGKANPSGHLNESYPLCYEDTPSYAYFPSKERNAEYREGIFVGYRYYDTAGVRTAYPFGYGLSYTNFAYSDLKIEKKGVEFTVTNIGSCGGAAVAQLYVGMPEDKVFAPKKELKGFQKVYLNAGESRRVPISFDDKTFRYWNVKTNSWETAGGQYRIMIGENVEEICLEGSMAVNGTLSKTPEEYPYCKENVPSYFTGKIQAVADREFTALLGHAIPDGSWSGELGMNDAICQMYYAKSGLARFLYRCLLGMKKKSEAKGKPDLNILFIFNMPFRAIAKMTGGAVSMEMVRGMVAAANGHFWKGISQTAKGFFVNKRENKQYEHKLKSREQHKN